MDYDEDYKDALTPYQGPSVAVSVLQVKSPHLVTVLKALPNIPW